MLSMFKDKKGFAVLFSAGGEEPRMSTASANGTVPPRRSSPLPISAARPSGRGSLTQLQCQRCSKRFSALEGGDGDDDAAGVCECHRCGYPTCPQCRESAPGTPAWVCCVCSGYKSLMWLLERTRAGPMIVTRIVEYCDPRGQRLMRSMFRFTLQQYHSPSPRPSLAVAARGSAGRAGSGAPSNSRRASQTPPAGAASSKPRTSSRLSGERSGPRLSQVSASASNVRRASPYTHPKHASLMRSARNSNTGCGAGQEAAAEAVGAVATAAATKENSPAAAHVFARPSEVLRRMEEPAGVVEYSPESKWRTAAADERDRGDGADEPSPMLPCDAVQPAPLAERCAAVADIYRASASDALSSNTATPPAEGTAAHSPLARPSGRAAFQRESVPPPPPAPQCPAGGGGTPCPNDSDVVVTPASATVRRGTVMTAATVFLSGQSGRFGRSLSPASSGSGRSASPAPRFPTFGQFLDDHAAVGAGQTHLPRESDVLVTVSSDSDDSYSGDGVIELCGGAAQRGGAAGGRSPRGAQPVTPPSGGGGGSTGPHSAHRASGFGNDYTPTRMLDMSSARNTLQLRSGSSRRRTTHGSVRELHAPQLYGNNHTPNGGNARRSGQMRDGAYAFDVASKLGSNAAVADSARVPSRRQNAPLATRTAGRALGSDARQRFVRQNSRTTTPLQRTASRTNTLQRMPSRNNGLARTNSSTAQLTRMPSSHGYGGGFARTNSTAAHPLVRTPSSRGHLAGPPSARGRLQRTESAKLTRTNSTYGPPRGPQAPGPAALERTYSRYGLPPASANASPLKRPPPLPSQTGSLLQRTASHNRFGGGATPPALAPFGRARSANCFTRSATAHTGFTRTASATRLGRLSGGARGLCAGRAFTRTATGTNLFDRTRGRSYHAGQYPSTLPPPTPCAAACPSGRGAASPRGTPSKFQRPAPPSPLRRVPSSSRYATPRTARGAPVAAPLSRSGTGTRQFERQPSRPLREAACSSSASAAAVGRHRTVDPAPTLMGAARRKGASTALRRTPSSTGTGTTPRTPRPFVISSVSTAANAAAVAGAGLHSGSRPLITSSASSPKRSTRGSLTLGSNVRSSGDTSSGLYSTLNSRGTAGTTDSAHHAAPQPQQPPQHPRPVAAPGVKERPPARVGTPTRRVAPGARPRTASAAPPAAFGRQNSRPHL